MRWEAGAGVEIGISETTDLCCFGCVFSGIISYLGPSSSDDFVQELYLL